MESCLTCAKCGRYFFNSCNQAHPMPKWLPLLPCHWGFPISMWLHCNHKVFFLHFLQSKYTRIWQLALQLILKYAHAVFSPFRSAVQHRWETNLPPLSCFRFPFSFPIFQHHHHRSLPFMTNTVFISSNVTQEPAHLIIPPQEMGTLQSIFVQLSLSFFLSLIRDIYTLRVHAFLMYRQTWGMHLLFDWKC